VCARVCLMGTEQQQAARGWTGPGVAAEHTLLRTPTHRSTPLGCVYASCSFPKADCVCLPVRSTSVEELSRLLVRKGVGNAGRRTAATPPPPHPLRLHRQHVRTTFG
jgi:hypothetical protein